MSSPISALNHLRIGVTDLDIAIADYRALLGVEPTQKKEGAHDSAVFSTDNVQVVLQRCPKALGLFSMCFCVSNLDAMRRRLGRLGLTVGNTAPESLLQELTLDKSETRGLPFSFVADSSTGNEPLGGAVTGLDHVVIATGDGDKTGFLLGAQLGLDLRMDLSNEAWDARLMFFRCGDLIVEVFQRLSEPTDPLSDHFYGLSWRVANADEARERLALEGFDVSEVRKGRKPGTRVLTVRNRTADVPTLLVEPPPPRG